MRAAFARLGWTPAAFWGATPRELAIALGLSPRGSGLTRGALAQLMHAYPDEADGI